MVTKSYTQLRLKKVIALSHSASENTRFQNDHSIVYSYCAHRISYEWGNSWPMRSFICLLLSPKVTEYLASTQQGFQYELEEHSLPNAVRWVQPDKMHLTLRFFGNISSEQRRNISAQLGPIATKTALIPFAFGSLGAFPNLKRPNVIWAGIVLSDALLRLQSQVEKVTQRAGIRPDAKPFSPHITLGRLRKRQPIHAQRIVGQIVPKVRLEGVTKENVESKKTLEESIWLFRKMSFYTSQLTSSGPIYSTVASYSLSGSRG